MRIVAFLQDRSGSFVSSFAVTLSVLFVVAGISMDYTINRYAASSLQEVLDAAVLNGAVAAGSNSDKLAAAQEFFQGVIKQEHGYHKDATATFKMNADGSLEGKASVATPLTLSAVFLQGPLQAGVKSAAIASSPPSGSCINVLGNVTQALLINSGANVQAPNCEVQVHSLQNPAMIMNASTTFNVRKNCLAGTQYIRNGATTGPIETACQVTPDPWFQKIPEPVVSNTCATQNSYNPGTYNLPAGVHCSPNFNGPAVLNFAPGLHIIKGRMILGADIVVNAQGVTFYFPDTDSEIRANSAYTFKASAPKTGIYSGVLMFEKTSDANNNNNKRDYFFNASISEQIEGLIYLPNRSVVYNSITNISANKTQIYVHAMTINAANWKLEPVAGSGSGKMVRLTK